MTISSLSKFTVPLANDQSSTTQGLLMPKLAYRFRVTLFNFGVTGLPATELTKQVISVGRPEVTFDDIKLYVYNSTVKLAGRHSFADVEFKVRDDVTNAVSQKVGEQLQKQFDFYEQSGAASGGDYKFTMSVELLDGGNGAFVPNVLESFEFLGCYLKKATYSGGDYSKGTDAMEITMSISYDNAIQVAGGNRVGGLQYRTLGTNTEA